MLAVACAGQPAARASASSRAAPGTADRLAALAVPGAHALDPAGRQDWPPAAWDHARAYAYNLVPAGPGHALRVWDAGGWSPDIAQTLPLDAEQASLALELTHRTQGEVRASKCAFPRHAVVFFDAQDQPVASVNVCFECSDILVWPPYFADEEAAAQRMAQQVVTGEGDDAFPQPLLFTVHDEVLGRWEGFFSLLGARRLAVPSPSPSESP